MDAENLLEVRGLNIYFRTPAGEIQAVRDLSFTIPRGQIVGMAGESGSGKSVTGLAILGLLPERATRVDGQIVFEGRDLLALSARELEHLRGRDIGMVFQEPMTALDPVFTIGQQISETLRAHRPVSRDRAKRASIEMLESVGIADPSRRYSEYPHQLSGGIRQRVMIAMALICEPALLIADEPTTAVDVTIQAQILDLIRNLTASRGTAVLFISHDLGVLAELCRDLVVVYAGEVVEAGPVDELLETPRHPYTAGLLQALPVVGRTQAALRSIPGRVPLPAEMPGGCRFHPRCAHTLAPCVERRQDLAPAGRGRTVRCWRHDQLTLAGALDSDRE